MTPYEPQPGDIGLTQISGNVGLGIRFGQWLCGGGFADFEHAFVYVGNGQIIEAEPGGALLSPLSRYDAARIDWLRCPPEYGEAVSGAALRMIGVPYSFLDYAAIAAHRLHLWAPGLKHYIETSGHMICSQLADRAAADGDWNLFNDKRWEGYVKPSDLYHLYVVQEQT